MGTRFRKRIKIAPGVHLNISKTGISTSLGPRGATVNVRGQRVRSSVGIPGSGLSYTEETTGSALPAIIKIALILLVIGYWLL